MFQIRFQQLVTSVSSLLCHSSTCLRIGSKLRCIRSTQSMSENDFECLASTGVNMTWTMFPNSGPVTIGLPRSRLSTKTCGPPDSLVFNFRIDRYTSVGRQGIRDCGREHEFLTATSSTLSSLAEGSEHRNPHPSRGQKSPCRRTLRGSCLRRGRKLARFEAAPLH
jgi:hypothetical protein